MCAMYMYKAAVVTALCIRQNMQMHSQRSDFTTHFNSHLGTLAIGQNMRSLILTLVPQIRARRISKLLLSSLDSL